MTLTRNKILIESVIKIAITVAVLTVCVLLVFPAHPRVINFFDEPYQIMNGMYDTPNALAPMTSLLTTWFGELFNWEWLPFRYLAIAVHFLCILSGGIYLYVKSKRFTLSIVVTALALILGNLSAPMFTAYSWNTWTELFIMPLIFLLLAYEKKQRNVYIVLSAFICALLTACRIPSISSIFIVFIIIVGIGYVKRKRKEGWLKGLVFILLSLVFSYGIFALIFKSPYLWFELVDKTGVAAHNPLFLITGYISTSVKTLSYVIIFLGIYVVLNYISKKFRSWLSWLAAVCLGVVVFSVMYNNLVSFENAPLIVPIAFCWFLMFQILFLNRDNLVRKDKCVKIYVLFLLSCIPFIGSNTGIINMLSWPVLPIFMALLLPNFDRRIILLFVSFVTAVSMYGIIRGIYDPFSDKGPQSVNYQIEHGLAEGLLFPNEDRDKFEKVYASFEPYCEGDYNILVFRYYNDYIWEYLFKAPNRLATNDFHYFSTSYDEKANKFVEEFIQNSDKPVAVLYMTHSTFEPEDLELLPLPQVFARYLEPVVIDDEFVIYTDKEILTNKN